MLYLGWLNRSQAVWTPESGWGYAFGVTGGVLMLLLVIYPLRKRWKALSRFGSVRFWFRVHMIFGLLGPAFIMMHSSYQLGSMNGKIAFFSMLTVSLSGLVGRYFYTRIHYGLYGKRATFESLRADSSALTRRLGPLYALNPQVQDLLRGYEKRALELPRGIIGSALFALTMWLYSVALYRRLTRELKTALQQDGQARGLNPKRIKIRQQGLIQLLDKHKKVLRQMQELHFYERLFAVWHHLHMPLFLMMVVTTIAHIYAVHAY